MTDYRPDHDYIEADAAPSDFDPDPSTYAPHPFDRDPHGYCRTCGREYDATRGTMGEMHPEPCPHFTRCPQPDGHDGPHGTPAAGPDPLDELPEPLASTLRATRDACALPCPSCGVGAGRWCDHRTLAR